MKTTVQNVLPAPAGGFFESLEAAFDRSPLPTAIVTGAGHTIRYANAAFRSLLLLPSERILQYPFAEIIPDEAECVGQLDRVLRSGRSEAHTERFNPNPNGVVWSYLMWPVGTDNPPAAIVVQVTETAQYHQKTVAMNEALMLGSLRQHEMREISEAANAQLILEIRERHEAETALLAAQLQLSEHGEKLEALVQLRTARLVETVAELEAFSYSIAHDLRAPLRSMQTFAEILLTEHGDQLNAEGRHYLTRIAKAATRMDQLTRDVLSYSQGVRPDFQLESVDMRHVILDVMETYPGFTVENAKITVEGEFPAILGNEAMVTQVFSNLMSNAVKFVVPGQLPQVKVWAESSGARARFFVQDFGIGVPADQHGRIFGVFEQLDKSYEGTGIGLAIVKKTVARMGGTVGVISELGKGTTLWFELSKA